MTTPHRDVIVVGARCAGSPTAMLLARQGYRVLLVDRATFPSDTISTQSSPPSNLHRRNSATSSPPFTATKRPWTASHGPTQA